MYRYIITCVGVVFCVISQIQACTAFVLQNENSPVLAKNFDWNLDIGYLMTNKRGVAKTALIDEQNEQPARWVSKYGSVTFNQISKEFPQGGMNEEGLVIESLNLLETKYQAKDERPGLMELQWIQYQLDNHKSVQEVIDSHKNVRITQNKANLHFIVCDQYGEMLIIEYINGELIYHRGFNLSIPVIANSTYKDSLKAYQRVIDSKKSLVLNNRSLERFVTTACKLEDKSLGLFTEKIPDVAFDILSYSLVSTYRRDTCWSIVYDIQNRTIHFNSLSAKNVKMIDFADLEFGKNAKALVLDVNISSNENIKTQWMDYTTSLNRDLVRTALNHIILPGLKNNKLPDSVIEGLAMYPELIESTQ